MRRTRVVWSQQAPDERVSVISGGDNFLYDFKPGRHGPDAPPLHPAMRSLPLRERAGRLARDKVGPVEDLQWLRPGEGGAHCAEPPPSVQPAAPPGPSGPSAHTSLGET